MAVEARHHPSIFPSQLLRNREFMNSIEANASGYNTQIGYGAVPVTTAAETLLPLYGGSFITDSIPHPSQKPGIQSDNNSTLTYNNNGNLPLPTRKRSRESINNNQNLSYPLIQTQKNCLPFSFLGQDLSLQLQEQQFDVDRLISQHMEKVRMEIEERRKREAKRIMEAIEGSVMKKLRAKEEEIEKIGKLNWALEEKVKSLCIENQIWRDLAQSNEATANALRTNLEQVLAAAQVKDVRTPGARGGFLLDEEVIDDAQSCCGSSWEDEEDEIKRLQRTAAAEDHETRSAKAHVSGMCRNCSKEESCVLLLPCRHLCLCTVCGSTLHTCPICKSPKTASVHVNLS